MVAILSCCNIVMSLSVVTIVVLKKTRGDGQQERNHAAVTMVIICVIYFIYFATSFPVLSTFLVPDDGLETQVYKDVIYITMLSLSCSFNSMVLVYILGKRQMQRYITEELYRLFCCRLF